MIMRALDRSLFQFLAQSLRIHHRFITGRISRPEETPIYVIGNPSADVDSIISALVYAYFAHPRPHVPLINLPDVPSGPELRRLRPEFIEALHLATHPPAPSEQPWDADAETQVADLLRTHLLTVADFAAHLTENKTETSSLPVIDAVLVDWNALPLRSPSQKGQGSLPGLPDQITFNVVGCIDHHVDENFLPPIAADQPYLIQPTGSCASLVVSMLERMGWWTPSSFSSSAGPDQDSPNPAETAPVTAAEAAAHENQLSKLALAPILIDTANFTAQEKVTEVDTLSYSFLRAKVHSTRCASQPPHGSLAVGICSGAEQPWSHAAFYARIAAAKETSLERLTVQEVLGRDYKEWVEEVPPSSSSSSSFGDGDEGDRLTIGICSVVQSLAWVIRKADGSSTRFLEEVETFARGRGVDIVVVMTAFSGRPRPRPAATAAAAQPSSPPSQTPAESGNLHTSNKKNENEKHKEAAFYRELLVCVPGSHHKDMAVAAMQKFVERGRTELGLEKWHVQLEEDEAVGQMWLETLEQADGDDHAGSSAMWKGVWVQGDVTKSRKQVAPLVREAVVAV